MAYWMIAAAAVSAYAKYKQGRSEKEQAEAQAARAKLRAEEAARRAEINIGIMERQGQKFISDKSTQMSKGQGLGQSDFEMLSNDYSNLVKNIRAARDEAEFDYAMGGMEADDYASMAGNIKTATYLNIGAGLLDSGYRIADSMGNTTGKSSSAPKASAPKKGY